jgi:tetratricopeptide (TPR) repeat protein
VTVEVPFQLARRQTQAAAADAFLLIADGFGPLAAACARLGGRQLPQVYPIRGGFLLVARDGKPPSLPGAIRLRRLSGELFLPADADLSPALLPDESEGLTRERGLVFLPGGEVLAFDPSNELTADRWLAPAQIRRGEWQPFPSRPERAEQLRIIEQPPEGPAAVIDMLDEGAPEGTDPLPGAGEGDAAGAAAVPEDARPRAGSTLKGLAAGAILGIGQLAAWLGRALRVPGLARAGAHLARKALEQVPRLTERILGAQEAALREVLRQLREGDVEKALRRAPIAVPDPDRPAQVGTGADLGSHDPRYSLRALIASGTAPATAWLGGGDVWLQLVQEYRRLAEEALRRGDHRRAAYLYGVLLRDLRSAANALMAGGLFHDAAILFRDRLRDEPAAASAFEQAGDYDEALRLYDRLGRYEQAAELLRRLGDEERAVEFFIRAADQLAGQNSWLLAGDLIRQKVGRRDLAAGYYRRGWEGRTAEAVICGERLLDDHLLGEEWTEVDKLFDEAEIRLAPPRSRDAGRFFNYALHVGAAFLPKDRQDDLADRSRLLFALHLRSDPAPGTLAGELFGSAGPWPGVVARDAAFASRHGSVASIRLPADYAAPVRLGDGTVTAVIVARDTFDLIVATTATVICWRVGDGRIIPILATQARQVIGLSTDPRGRIVSVLRAEGSDVILRCFAAHHSDAFHSHGVRWIEDPELGAETWYLQPSASLQDDEPVMTLAGPAGRTFFYGRYLRTKPPERFLPDGRDTHLLVVGADGCAWDWDERFMRCLPSSPGAGPTCRWLPAWRPAIPAGSPLLVKPIDWLAPAPRVLEVTGLDSEGILHWSEFDARDPDNRECRTVSTAHPDCYLAACLMAPGKVAAVTGQNEVHWLEASAARLKPWAASRRLSVPARAVALAARPPAHELLVILEDGSVVRLPWP